MIHFSSKKIFLILVAIMFSIVFGKFFSIISFPDSETALEKGDPPLELRRDASLTQTFVANRDNLMKIELLLRTPGPKGSEAKMEIADENCSDTIRQGILEKPFLASDNLYDFQFSKIPDSNGKIYCLKVTLTHGKSKLIRLFTKENYDPRFILNNETRDKSLSMRLAYKNSSFIGNMSELNQRISQYKPWFLKHYFLDAISIFFIILSVAIVAILIAL
jgi:hypothetical protein